MQAPPAVDHAERWRASNSEAGGAYCKHLPRKPAERRSQSAATPVQQARKTS